MHNESQAPLPSVVGGGVYVNGDSAPPNYNLIMTVNHKEWVYRWAKYALPHLPEASHHAVKAYVLKHAAFLKTVNLYPKGRIFDT